MNVRWLGPFGGIKKQLVWAYIGYSRQVIHLSNGKYIAYSNGIQQGALHNHAFEYGDSSPLSESLVSM